MEVNINHQTFFVKEPNLLSALQSYGLKQTKGVAIAVNDCVVRKSDWEVFQIHPGDRITVITAAQGG
ncbi:sulfur carrier protein ThiS [Olivibacter sp. XZL3]|uniref:sulfur carrier protein ThiS n=1 Tax=Olivibacter sp. XZL3 TaxID=1735116 RepID=UPI0010656915|nr:sulfur carrier protein ThiS [Olivibacter sp. XZL3]